MDDAIRDQFIRRLRPELQAESLNSELAAQMGALTTLLASGVRTAGPFDFQTLRRQASIGRQDPTLVWVPKPEPTLAGYLPDPLGSFETFVPWTKRAHAEATNRAKQRFEEDLQKHRKLEAARENAHEEAVAAARARHERTAAESKREADRLNSAIDILSREYSEGKISAVAEYSRLVLDRSKYPEKFPKAFKIAYLPASRQLVIEYDCPTINVIPENASYRYVKSKGETVSTQIPAAKRRALYSNVIAQITLRTLHELFRSDGAKHIDTITFNGYVQAIDGGTGHTVRPCIVTVRTSRDFFECLDLSKVEPLACLKTLSASVSPRPSELAPVRPVLEFNMVDPRFVEEADILSSLDQRPNLMALSPSQFESLITNLFEKMGLETRQTQASRDGGVDCVAFDPRPIFGGKVVIQAKRYKHTVGVGSVRDLFGTMQNEGASKGILVTTSGYGKASFEFAKGKPLELLEGSHLLFLLEEHTGVKAKIEPPDTWEDPAADAAETD